MSKELQYKFYSKIVRLLQSKKSSTVDEKKIAALFQEYGKKGNSSEALVNLGLDEIHNLIAALQGQGQNQGIEKDKLQKVYGRYVSSVLPILEKQLNQLLKCPMSLGDRQALESSIDQVSQLQKMMEAIRKSDIDQVMACMISSYPKQTPEIQTVITSSLKQIGRPVVLALVDTVYKEHEQDSSELPKLLKEMGYLAIPALMVALCYPEEPVRFAAAKILKTMKAREAVPALVEALDDPSWRVRKVGVESLGEIGSNKAVEGLISALDDKHAAVRLEIVHSLGKVKDPKVLTPLLTKLDDRSWEIRHAAVESMAKQGPIASRHLAKALDNDSLVVRKIAARILADIGNEDAAPALVRAIQDKDISVREKAVMALGRIQRHQALDTLKMAIKDPAPLVRLAVVEILMDLDNQEAKTLLECALDDSEIVIQQRAKIALQSLSR